MKSLKELEKSDDLQERILYLKLLKQELVLSNEAIKTSLSKDKEISYNRNLKNKIASYDVYRQKVVVKCRVCKEVDCVCYVLKPEITEVEINKLF